jgi:hypothetical protein
MGQPGGSIEQGVNLVAGGFIGGGMLAGLYQEVLRGNGVATAGEGDGVFNKDGLVGGIVQQGGFKAIGGFGVALGEIEQAAKAVEECGVATTGGFTMQMVGERFSL